MKLGSSSESSSDSNLSETLDELNMSVDWPTFGDRDYGAGVVKVFIIFICMRDVGFPWPKRRSKYSAIDKRIYLDVVVDYQAMKLATRCVRRSILADALLTGLPPEVRRLRIKDFDSNRFLCDFDEWVRGWRDEHCEEDALQEDEPEVESAATKGKEFLREVHAQIGPLMTRFGFSEQRDHVEEDLAVATFTSQMRAVALLLAISSRKIIIHTYSAGHRKVNQAFIISLTDLEGGDAVLLRQRVGTSRYKTVGQLTAPRDGDLSATLNGLATHIEQSPKLFLPD